MNIVFLKKPGPTSEKEQSLLQPSISKDSSEAI